MLSLVVCIGMTAAIRIAGEYVESKILIDASKPLLVVTIADAILEVVKTSKEVSGL